MPIVATFLTWTLLDGIQLLSSCWLLQVAPAPELLPPYR